MKFLDEYRDAEAVRVLARTIAEEATRPWVLMEVCGGQTHAIMRYGLDALLPETIELLHGPGCPVCVTGIEVIDRAHAIASEPDVVFCSFGDMLRVPGSTTDLLRLKASGCDVRIVYSPLDAVALARKLPDKRVVFFAIGFETTAPANAMAASVALKTGVKNFSMLVAHVRVPPVLTTLLESPTNRVQAFLGPGHVCTIMGTREYEPIVERYHVPLAIAGFEPVDLLAGVLACVRQLERGDAKIEIPYSRAVLAEGNPKARQVVDEVFEPCDRSWRGIGTIPLSGLRLRSSYAALDADRVFRSSPARPLAPSECISGEILKGAKKPYECPAFGTRCTPESPLGATMVSSEGACAAYLAFGVRERRRALPILKEVDDGAH